MVRIGSYVMLENTTIICFGEDITHSLFSKYQIMKRLARANDVFYIESIGQRTPTLSRRDMARIAGKLRRLLARPAPAQTDSAQTITDFRVIKPLVLPFHQIGIVQVFNAAMLARQLGPEAHGPKARRHPLVLWVGLPTVPRRLLDWKPDVVVYHCADKLVANVSGPQRTTLDAMHRFWTQRADLTLTPSEVFLAELRDMSPRAHLLPHGVDYDHFAQARAGTLDIPADMAALPRPIVGYYGTISREWFDVGVIGAAARQRPGVTFVLIGPVHAAVRQHPDLQRPNIHFLGPRPYASLPAYLTAFDVCIIPKVRSEMTAASMPLKLREYLAAGKPVVTTLQHGDRFAPLVEYAADADQFIAALDRGLHDNSPEAQDARQAAVRSDSWDAVVARLSDLVETVLNSQQPITHC
ncbi:MAG: glycosyltransferase [Anaerolineae bacterium]|nr:glycosyltransferase [Anaerolineae bacterium]